MPLLSRLGLCLTAGIGLSFIQSPYEYWFLIFPCLGGFYYLFTLAENKKQAFLSGFLFAFGYHVAGLYWIGNALLIDGNPYQWAWPLAVIALPALLALFTALYVTISHRLFGKSFLFFCLSLTLAEWVRGHAFTGFPWNLYGYGWIGVLPIAQSASVIGSYGLTFITILVGSAAGYVVAEKVKYCRIAVFAAALFLLAGIYIWGDYRLKNNGSAIHQDVMMHVVQPNIAQADKWNPDNLAGNFEKHIQLSLGIKEIAQDGIKNVFIWPETSLPPSFLNSPIVNKRIQSVLGSDGILLAGGLQITKDGGYHNALMMWDGSENAKRLYSKSHLVPFGEYIPFQKYIPLRPVVEFSGFNRGDGTQTISIAGYPSFSPLICYEIIFPGEAVNEKQTRPDYILTITNDAWYGDSPGPYQHFTQARFRAIEQGLPVIRSANTGISGIIDPYGRVVERLSLGQEGMISQHLPRKQ